MSVESMEDVAQRLYGLLPEEFTTARDLAAREARADGDRATAKAISGLRRPSLAAWLVNALIRHRRDEVEQLLSLGEALRTAQFGLGGDDLRALNRQRQQLIAAVGRQARALARELGHPVSDDVGQEVEATLGAAMADPEIAEAVRSGRLTSPTSYAGLGTPDADAPPSPRLAAVPSSPPETPRRPRKGEDDEAARRREEQRRQEERRREEERRTAELAQARQEAQEAQQAWEDAVTTARAAGQRQDDAERSVAEARERIDDLQDQLRRAEETLATATRDERSLRRERDAADRVADLAGKAAQRARTRVERLDTS